MDTVKKVVLENDNSRPFLTSSPTNGIKSDEENYIAQDPYSSLYGDGKYFVHLIYSVLVLRFKIFSKHFII